ncbi:MAG: response regulator [bacterium]|nr:response regulator [bacterium]
MSPKTIALIEDDKILSDTLYSGLTDVGLTVTRAFDGEEGLNLVVSTKPSLVLLDILMPKMDGLTVAKKLKANPETKNIPIIILTVLNKTATMAEAIEEDVYEYIIKSDYKVEDIVKIVQEKLAG